MKGYRYLVESDSKGSYKYEIHFIWIVPLTNQWHIFTSGIMGFHQQNVTCDEGGILFLGGRVKPMLRKWTALSLM